MLAYSKVQQIWSYILTSLSCSHSHLFVLLQCIWSLLSQCLFPIKGCHSWRKQHVVGKLCWEVGIQEQIGTQVDSLFENLLQWFWRVVSLGDAGGRKRENFTLLSTNNNSDWKVGPDWKVGWWRISAIWGHEPFAGAPHIEEQTLGEY